MMYDASLPPESRPLTDLQSYTTMLKVTSTVTLNISSHCRLFRRSL